MHNVMSKEQIVSAYIRAREHLDHNSACAAVAQSLGGDVDTVSSVVAEHLARAGEEMA